MHGAGDIDALRKRLFLLARRLSKRDIDWCHDVASDALLSCLDALQTGKPHATEWHYASAVLSNALKTRYRDASRREVNLPNKPDEEIVELCRGLDGGQIMSAMLADVMIGLSCLPERSRNVMCLVALGYEPDEIAVKMGMPKQEVYWRTRESRKILRSKGYWDDEKQSSTTWIGIRRDCRKWTAAIRSAGRYHHLGYFDTAIDAAKAYDEAARQMHGAKAKLNFAA